VSTIWPAHRPEPFRLIVPGAIFGSSTTIPPGTTTSQHPNLGSMVLRLCLPDARLAVNLDSFDSKSTSPCTYSGPSREEMP
jgi:hypothetical protein